ncbi:MAG TPA: hypothetical protein VGA92_03015 [Candidatus Nitrosotenuis sp.]
MNLKRYATCTKKRGVSQIIGTMFMLALVVPVGTVIVTKGLNEVGEMSNRLTSGITYQNEGGREDIVFEHIRLDPTGNQVTITLRNAGTIDTTINKITMVKIDTQELLISDKSLAVDAQPRIGTDILSTASLQFSGRWDDPNYVNSEYKISILTSKGNFFETVARPFNT